MIHSIGLTIIIIYSINISTIAVRNGDIRGATSPKIKKTPK